MRTIKQQKQIDRLKKMIEIDSNGEIAKKAMIEQLKRLEKC